jgi:glutamine cyclotransferase
VIKTCPIGFYVVEFLYPCTEIGKMIMSETLKYMFKGVMLAVGVILLSGLVNCTYPQNPVSYTFKVVETLPHDRNAYTQGLFFHNGVLYESCGQYGQSHFKKCELSTGKALRRLDFEPQYFAEGACVLNNMLYILTWQEHKCFVYDINTLK